MKQEYNFNININDFIKLQKILPKNNPGITVQIILLLQIITNFFRKPPSFQSTNYYFVFI